MIPNNESNESELNTAAAPRIESGAQKPSQNLQADSSNNRFANIDPNVTESISNSVIDTNKDTNVNTTPKLHHTDVASIYPSAINKNVTTSQKDNIQPIKQGKFKKHSLWAILGVLILAIAYLFLYVQKDNSSTSYDDGIKSTLKDSAGSQSSKKTIMDSIYPRQREILKQFKDITLFPTNIDVKATTIYYSTPNEYYMMYKTNARLGSGISSESFIIWVLPDNKQFNPPGNCLLIAPGSISKDIIRCEKYDKSNKIDAFIYRYKLPSNFEQADTNPFNTYARVGNSIIMIEAADTDPSVIYDIILNMKKIDPEQLPYGTAIIN